MECNASYSIYPQYVLLPNKCVFRLICHYQIYQVFCNFCKNFLIPRINDTEKKNTNRNNDLKGIFISSQTENNYTFI